MQGTFGRSPTLRRIGLTGLATALVAGLAALVPVAPAQAVDFGDSSGRPPNTAFGCEAGPRVANSNGDFGLFPSGVASCTWMQLPTFGSAVSGGAPVTGRVTAVRVRSGPNPAPLRFTVVRTVSGVDAQGKIIPNSTQCCFGQSMTRSVAMRPNAVTAVPLNLPVVAGIDTRERVAIQDFVGISATSGQGTLPVALTVNRPPNTADYAAPGVPSVTMHYPEVGPNQVRTDATSAPAHLITARFTMCRDDSVFVRGARTAARTRNKQACGGRITTGAASVSSGKVRLPVRCVGSCSGKIEIRRATGKGLLAKSTKFRIGVKGKKKVVLRATKAGKQATRGTRSVRAKVVMRAQGAKVTRTVQLR